MSDLLLARLEEAAGGAGSVRTGEPMSRHTTFRAGGPAAYFAAPSSVKELSRLMQVCREEGLPCCILGNGSNLLVSDAGYPGLMISMESGFCGCQAEGNVIRAGAGILLSRVAKKALEHSLTGFEFAAGIPGTLGGAVVMNAGAYGGELCQVLKSAVVLDREGAVKTLSAEELEFGYRRSCIPKRGYIVLEAELSLMPGDQSSIRARMEDLAARRREKQPLEYPSAGSTFKRPEGYFAGKLIEDAGLRGFSVGGAQVSEKHCGFVINRKNAAAGDIYRLCQAVRKKVREQFGVELELEVKLAGPFEELGENPEDTGGNGNETGNSHRNVRSGKDHCLEDTGRSGLLLRG